MRRLKSKEIDAILSLQAFDGWKLVVEVLREQEESLMRALLEPVRSVDEAVSRAYYLGRVAAIREFVKLPSELAKLGDMNRQEGDPIDG